MDIPTVITCETRRLLTAVRAAWAESRAAFSEYEAGDFLTGGGRMESDGPDAADLLNEAEAERDVYESPWLKHSAPAGTFSFPETLGGPVPPGAAEERPAPASPAGAGPPLQTDAELVTTAANQLQIFRIGCWNNYRRDYLNELIAELRDFAAQLEAAEFDVNNPFPLKHVELSRSPRRGE